jgi:hypothetical protein
MYITIDDNTLKIHPHSTNQHLRPATMFRWTAQRRKARCLPETFLSSSFYMLPSKSFHYGLVRWVSKNLAVGNLLNHAVGGLDAHAVVLAGIDLCCGVSFRWTQGVSWIKHTSSGDGCGNGENSHGEDGSDDGDELHVDGWKDFVVVWGELKLFERESPGDN